MNRARPALLALVLVCLLIPGLDAADRSVMELLDDFGADLQWDPVSRTGTFWAGSHSLTVTAGEPLALADFSEVKVIDPPVYQQDMLYVTQETYAMIANFLEQHRPPRRSRIVDAIVIDPGHGGRDGGATRELEIDGELVVAREKDIVLDIGLRVAARLRRILTDARITMTRTDDSFPELGDRTDFAHAQREDPLDNVLFVSIHANASVATWTEARGVEIFYLQPEERRDVLEESVREDLDPQVAYILNDLKEDEYTWESKRMASFILDAVSAELPDTPIDRGIQEASYYVNRVARMPSILIETGFVNNRDEVRQLLDPDYRGRLANAIAAGIAAYVADFEQVR